MFAYLFGSAVQLIFGVLFVIFLYQVFLSDLIKDKRQRVRDSKAKYDSVDKIGRVKLTSDDPKEIEKFITDNAQYLSDPMVKQLVERIEMIKNDRIINADSILKKRIDALEPVEEEPAVVKRASRKR